MRRIDWPWRRQRARPLACRELVEVITDYLEGSLPDDQRTRFEGHLAECSGCRAYLEQMRQTIRLAGHLSADALPSEMCGRLLTAFREWSAG